jgi:prepilin-type N-terminal cleavage/methylation domain-containing protein
MRQSSGFTLIEILIVVVILGILATIAIPKFSASKEKAFLASMKSDLRNLATQQEAYMTQYEVYTTSFPTTVWQTTTGVTGPTIAVVGNGWNAWVGHTTSPVTCAIFVGNAALSPATQENVPKCSN